MSKRVLSLCLALAVLLLALPVIPFGNANAAVNEKWEVLPGEVNPVFTQTTFPNVAVDKKIQDFEGTWAEGENPFGDNYVWGSPSNIVYPYMVATTPGNATGTIEDGAMKLVATNGATNYMGISVYMDNSKDALFTKDTTMLVFHLDTTGVTFKEAGKMMAVRLSLQDCQGHTGVKSCYILDNKTYYFQP
ncbi:MAG: hypothetical protein IIW23_04165, partial [Clostridia bacterium]|nr:hypothetical protein [Clostridia bacterium]